MAASRKGTVGLPPLQSKDKVFTLHGMGFVVRAERTPKGTCIYYVVVQGHGLDVYDHSQLQRA